MPATSYHIVRNGQPVGQFAPDEIESKLQDGTLLPDDRAFLDTERKWISLNEWRVRMAEEKNNEENASSASQNLQNPQNPQSPQMPISGKNGKPLTVHTDFGIPRAPKSTDRPRPTKKNRERRENLNEDDFTAEDGSTAPRESNYRKRRKKASFLQSLYGYIFAAVAILIAAACFYWGLGQRKQKGSFRQEILTLKAEIKSLTERNRILLQPVPPDQIIGTVGIEDSSNQFVPLASATVTLYRRADVEAFIESRPQLNSRPSVTEAELVNIIAAFQTAIPKPRAATLTNSDGTFQFTVPNSGDYILLICANRTIEGEQVVWLQGVRTGSPSQRLLLTDRNAASAARFHFRIIPPPGVVAW